MADPHRLPPGPTTGLHFATHAEYYAWAEQQPRGRFERVGGEVIRMSAERGAHLRRKISAFLALREAIATAGLPCQALPDGVTVQVGQDINYEPDAVVNCGPPMGDDALAAPCPVVIVEVTSPRTHKVDAGIKLSDYFRVSSVAHYLIVDARRRLVIHHRRRDDGGIETRPMQDGTLVLDPPGLRLELEALFRDP